MKRILVTAAIVFAIDQLSKLAILRLLDLPRLGLISVLPPYLNFRMAWNQGVNFGLFANGTEIMRWVLVILSLAISLWLLLWARRLGSAAAHVFAGLVIGGALGNALDRVVYGAVVDYLNTSCCGLNNPFAFNLADVAIFSGAFGLVLISNKLDKNG